MGTGTMPKLLNCLGFLLEAFARSVLSVWKNNPQTNDDNNKIQKQKEKQTQKSKPKQNNNKNQHKKHLISSLEFG